MEKRVTRILEDQDSLNDKEYIDLLVKFMKGESCEKPKKAKNEFCMFEMKEEEAEKLGGILELSEDILLYFVK